MGAAIPSRLDLPTISRRGSRELHIARQDLRLCASPTSQPGVRLVCQLGSVAVSYYGCTDVEEYVFNGRENVTRMTLRPNPYNALVHCYSGVVQTGIVNASKKNSSEGLHLQVNAVENILYVTRSLTTTIYGVLYEQPTSDI